MTLYDKIKQAGRAMRKDEPPLWQELDDDEKEVAFITLVIAFAVFGIIGLIVLMEFSK